MKNIIFSLILISLLASCSSSVETTKLDIPSELSNKIVISQSGKISIHIPVNWRNILDNNETVFDIWLVSSENNAMIGFIPLTIDQDLDNDDAVNLLTKFSLESKKVQSTEFEFENETPIKEIGDFSSKGLKYKFGDKKYSSIIFGKDDIYYECLAYFGTDYNATEDEFDKLVNLQGLVIYSAVLNK